MLLIIGALSGCDQSSRGEPTPTNGSIEPQPSADEITNSSTVGSDDPARAESDPDEDSPSSAMDDLTPVEPQDDGDGLATLAIVVPAKLFPEARWWVYIDGDIVGSSEDVTVEPNGDFWKKIHIVRGTRDFILRDSDGIIMSSSDGMLRGVRDGYYDKIFVEAATKVAPGAHKVEFIFFDESIVSAGPDVCFAISSARTSLRAGDHDTIRFSIPSRIDTSDNPAPMARGNGGLTYEKILDLGVANLKELMSRFLSDPRVKAIRAAYAGLNSSSSDQSKVYINMPDNCGGARYYDATLINIIVDKLLMEYEYYAPIATGFNGVTGEIYSKTQTQQEAINALYRIVDQHN